MKIRGKLLVAIFSIILGFVMVFGFTFFFAGRILSLKNLENKVNIAVANMYKLNNQTRNLMISEGDFSALNSDWDKAIKDFDISFKSLVETDDLETLNKQIQDLHQTTENIWEITQENLNNTSDLFMTVIESDLGPEIQKKSVLRFFWETQNNDSKIAEHYKILPLIQKLVSVQNESVAFLSSLEELRSEIQHTVAQYLFLSILIDGIIISVIIIIAVIFGIIFSNRLADKIKLVESSLYSISRGNFTQKLLIEGHDEFGRLATSFNQLMSNLGQKLDAVKEFMRKVAMSMKNDFDINHCFYSIITEIVESMEADAGVILLKEEKGDTFRVAARKGIFSPPYEIPQKNKEKVSTIQAYIDHTPIDMTNNLFAESFLVQQQIYCKNNFVEKKYVNINSEDILAVSSFIINPLFLKGEIIGVIGVFKHKKDMFFSELDVFHFNAFSEYSSLLLENISQYTEILKKQDIQKELTIARQIQQDLLFSQDTVIPGLEIETYSNSADVVGGDYINVKKLNKKTVSILIADVSGKGVPASMIMVMIHSICNLIVTENRKPADVLKFVNKGIEAKTSSDRFVTMQFLTIDKESKTVQFANAGHLPMLVYRKKDDAFDFIDADGIPIGIEKNSEYKQVKLNIDTGDILVLYSDGITEAANNRGEQYGIERLKTVIQSNSEYTIAEMKENIILDINTFVGKEKQHDDQSLILARL